MRGACSVSFHLDPYPARSLAAFLFLFFFNPWSKSAQTHISCPRQRAIPHSFIYIHTANDGIEYELPSVSGISHGDAAAAGDIVQQCSGVRRGRHDAPAATAALDISS